MPPKSVLELSFHRPVAMPMAGGEPCVSRPAGQRLGGYLNEKARRREQGEGQGSEGASGPGA